MESKGIRELEKKIRELEIASKIGTARQLEVQKQL